MGSLGSWLGQIMDFFYRLAGNYGLSIIMLTFLIRLVLLPVTYSQTRSLQKLQALEPERKKLEQRYKNDPQRLTKETMELWRRHKVTPLAGCLPLLVQLPFFVIFFNFLRAYSYAGDPGFLWVPHLGEKDLSYALPVLAGVTTYWQMAMTPGDRSQRMMVYLMPAMIGVLSINFPAGVTLYWVANNLFSIVQQYLQMKPSPVKGESR